MTPSELYAKVLEKLEVVGQGQTATAADALLVEEAYASLHEQLMDAELIDWAVTDDLPDWSVRILVRMLAADLVTEFGVSGERAASLMMEGGWNLPQMSLAERQLRKHQATEYISTPARPDYF